MSNFEIIPLFATPLFITDVPELKEEHRQFIMNCDYEHKSGEKHSLSTDKHILDNPILRTLKDCIMEKIKIYNEHGLDIQTKNNIDNIDFFIRSSWAVKIFGGNSYIQHIHSRSIYSGVLYINVDEHSGNINFTRQQYNTTLSSYGFSVNKWNYYNSHNWFIKPTIGKLVLFPSTLIHHMSVNKSNITRYSIAFDVYIKGCMGKNSTSETYF